MPLQASYRRYFHRSAGTFPPITWEFRCAPQSVMASVAICQMSGGGDRGVAVAGIRIIEYTNPGEITKTIKYDDPWFNWPPFYWDPHLSMVTFAFDVLYPMQSCTVMMIVDLYG